MKDKTFTSKEAGPELDDVAARRSTNPVNR